LASPNLTEKTWTDSESYYIEAKWIANNLFFFERPIANKLRRFNHSLVSLLAFAEMEGKAENKTLRCMRDSHSILHRDDAQSSGYLVSLFVSEESKHFLVSFGLTSWLRRKRPMLPVAATACENKNLSRK
jgi:hypothetical protein